MHERFSTLPQGPIRRWFSRLTAEPRRLLQEDVLPGDHISLKDRLLLWVYLLARALWDSDITSRAAATAYSFVFAVIPLLTTTLAFLTAFPGLQDERKTLEDSLFSYLLPGAVTEVQGYLAQFADAAAAAGTVSSLVFVASVLLLFHSLEGSYNRIWHARRARTWGERLQVLAVFIVVGALASLVMITISREARQLTEQVTELNLTVSFPALAQAGLYVINLLTACAIFITANKVFPKIRVRWVPAIVGGAFAGTVWHFLKDGFSWYISEVASYENIYGALGTIPVFFLWLYLTFVLLFVGAYAAYVSQNLVPLIATGRSGPGSGEHRAYHAVSVCTVLAKQYEQAKGPLSVDEISCILGISAFFVRQVLEALATSGMVSPLWGRKGAPTRYLLLKPPEQLTLGAVVNGVTGHELGVFELQDPSPLHQRIHHLFQLATSPEGAVLFRETIAGLMDLIDVDPEGMPEGTEHNGSG